MACSVRSFPRLLVFLFLAIGLFVSEIGAQDCQKATECCAPGQKQAGDSNRPGDNSFCTHKPFEQSYTIKRGRRVPMQVNLVDYCTDDIVYSSYFAPYADEFSLINFPCTYQAAPCASWPEGQNNDGECEAGRSIWEKMGCLNNGSSLFIDFVEPRICNEKNYPSLTKPGDARDYVWVPPTEGDVVEPPKTGGCNCNWELMRNNTAARHQISDPSIVVITTGVPDGFIKAGMSTFYVQVVIGGRSTSEPSDPNCRCTSPQDTSAACMCELGRRKVPYVYNNSVIPYLTALVSMKGGKLIFKRTYITYNFESNGIGCAGCSVDYCWGVPAAELEGWGYMGHDHKGVRTSLAEVVVEHKLTCGIPLMPDPNDASATFCRYPQTAKDMDACSLKIYVAWVGTDGYGHSCTSSNEMFSKFTQMGVSNIAVAFVNGVSNLATTVDRRITGRED